MSQRKRVEPGDTVPLMLTAAERDAIVAEVVPPPDLEDKLRLGLAKGGLLQYLLTLDELDELQGWVAATANHSRKQALQRTLDAVFNKIEWLLEGYTDEEK